MKVVLVTGGSSGIGRSIARLLSSEGFSVYGSSRDTTHGTPLDNFTMVKMDVTDADSVEAAINHIIAKEGRLDILVNNAGLGMAGPLENTTMEEAKDIFETNVFGLLKVCQTCIPHLRKQQESHIINITSIGARFGLPFRGIYCSSKFAVEGMTESMSMELKQFGIRVSLVEPGDIKTNINANRKLTKYIDEPLYQKDFSRTLNQINQEVLNGQEPEVVAQQVLKIAKSVHPKVRYRPATFMQKLSVQLKKMISDRLFERLIMGHYKMKRK